ncbi:MULTISPECIES: hypothetical protein [Actinoplanes]|uniref:hypothetical protein n=1 Tax=Actinoplanes TaxID=1865 RepID=UPI0005F2E434|nr:MULTISPECIES: hypothetical protein [Actinoplanes]GLY07743.1 hypothetical protein Acsp01_81220 [Actinoplanes sp. NBRC 101535]
MDGRPGRVSRAALLSIVAAWLGAGLFDDVADTWRTVAPFVLVVAATSALTAELAGQAGRHPRRWAFTDTANLLILLILAALLAASAAFARTPPHERTSAACFAVLYLVLGIWFWHARRHRLR